MKMPDPNIPTRLVDYPHDPALHYQWIELDAKIRLHNLAKGIARLPHREARNRFLDEMRQHHSEGTLAVLRKLVARYWREQRRRVAKQQEQFKKAS